VLVEGPTDYLELARGETVWSDREYNDKLDYASYGAGDIHEPEPATQWEWNHALGHASEGDQPPIARVLLTTAQRAAAIGDWRVATVDSATAAEVALTAGLTARLATNASPDTVKARIDRTRMLGPRLRLAKDLGMTLPSNIDNDLLSPRNAVIHRGAEMTISEAWKAIAAAQSLVDEYEPLAPHCQRIFPDSSDCSSWEPDPD